MIIVRDRYLKAIFTPKIRLTPTLKEAKQEHVRLAKVQRADLWLSIVVVYSRCNDHFERHNCDPLALER